MAAVLAASSLPLPGGGADAEGGATPTDGTQDVIKVTPRNALLLRNPSVANLLDGCAISLPCQEEGELPVGLMLWSTAAQDDLLLSLALQIEPLLNARP